MRHAVQRWQANKTVLLLACVFLLVCFFVLGLAFFGPVSWYRLTSIRKQEEKLYIEKRSFPYRWPGVGYTPYIPERPNASLATKLTSRTSGVELRLMQLLPQFETDPRWVSLTARLDLLSGNYADAVVRFRRASMLGAQDSKGWIAIALALRAESENRPSDYGLALEYVSESLRLNSYDPTDTFNCAVMLEKVSLLRLAQRFWQRTITVEKDPKWRAEEKEHLRDLEQRISARSVTLYRLTDPAVRDPGLFAQPGALEIAQHAMISRWENQPLRYLDSERFLAVQFLRHHRDHWWDDFLRFPVSAEALSLLGRSQRDYDEGRFSEAERDGAAAELVFRQLGNEAGAARARWQRITSSHRGDNPSSCTALLKGFESVARIHSWKWLLGQYWLDEITCRNLMYIAPSLEDREKVFAKVEAMGFEGITLRAIAFLAEPQVASGSPKRLWFRGLSGLNRFWAGFVPVYRIHHLAWCLSQAALMENKPSAAVLFAQESALNLDGESDNGLRAQVVSELALAESHAGLFESAAHDFDSIKTVNLHSSYIATSRYIYEVEQNRAEGELQSGNPDAAIERLTQIADGSQVRRKLNDMERAAFTNILGRAFLLKRQFADAVRQFDESLAINHKILGLNIEQLERESLRQLYESGFRGMTEARLRLGLPADSALRIWDSFRGGSIPLGNYSTARLTFATLPGGISAWISIRGKTVQKWLSAESVGAVAEHLTMLAADPGSSVLAVHDAGKAAGRCLLGPFEAELEAHPEIDTLVIDSDYTLARFPWALALTRDGKPLINRYIFSLSMGPPRPDPGILTNNSRAIVFADPDPGELRKDFPFLPDADVEASMIAALFRHAEIITGREATQKRLAQEVTNADILHFAGHGITNGGFGGLVLAGDPHFLGADEISHLDMQRLKLVVLAACSAGLEQETNEVNADTLVRGFLDAGALRVVASSWDVNSASTQTLMQLFYSGLASGERPAAALRKAMLKLASTPGKQHPYIWGGFQLYGAP